MHLSFYKRPLFILFCIYVLCLLIFLKVPEPKQTDIALKSPLSATITAKLNSYSHINNKQQSFYAQIIKINEQKEDSLSYLICNDCPLLHKGQIITFEGSIMPTKEQINKGSFAWDIYLARKHIFTQTKVNEIKNIETPINFWYYLSIIRESILQVFRNNLPNNSSAILSGITLGEKATIDKKLYSAFQDSGAMHLLVASGSNVGFVTILIYFLCSLFIVSRYKKSFLALFFALIYTLIAGADAPLIRAYLMTLTSTIGFLLGRKSGLLQGLILAGFLILLFNPQSLFEAGFEMSFLATLAIVLFSSNFSLKYRLNKITKSIIEIFLISLVAQLSLLPIFINYFNKLSLSAVLSNIFLVPLSAILMGGGFLLWLVSFISSLPFDFVLFIVKKLLILFEGLVNVFANLSISHIFMPNIKITTILAYYLSFFSLLHLPLIKNKIKFLGIVFSISLCIFCCGFFIKNEGSFLLKGKYNYSAISIDKEKVIVLGGGVRADILEKALFSYGKDKIDCLFINSLSNSAFYGLKNLHLKISNIYLPYGEIDDEILSLLEQTKAKIFLVFPNESYCLTDIKTPTQFIGAKTYNGNNLVFSNADFETSPDLKEIHHKDKVYIF